MPKNPLKDLNKKIKNTTKTIGKGFNKEIQKPLKKAVDKVTTQVKPVIDQTNQEITKAVAALKSQVKLVASQSAPVIAQAQHEVAKAAKIVAPALQPNKTRSEAIAQIFKGQKKSTGIKTQPQLIKAAPKKPSPNVTAKQDELSNISPAEPTIPTTKLPENKGISGTTLGVMVAGGIALGAVGALFGDFTSGVGFIMNMTGGVIAGAITGGAAAVATEVMGGSPKVEQLAENAKKTGIGYSNKIIKSKPVQNLIKTSIKAALKLVKDELKKPQTQQAIKDEIVKAVKKEVYTKPTEKIKKQAKAFGALFKATSSARKYKAPTKQREQQSR